MRVSIASRADLGLGVQEFAVRGLAGNERLGPEKRHGRKVPFTARPHSVKRTYREELARQPAGVSENRHQAKP